MDYKSTLGAGASWKAEMKKNGDQEKLKCEHVVKEE